jgi:hypothetical protein
MTKLAILLSAAAALPLSACATTSFSPPSVNLENETYVRGSNVSWGQRCMPVEHVQPVKIEQTVDGARALIKNFVYMYRCRAHSAANGRQAFEVPAFLALIGATTAVAFGAGHDVAVAGGAASSLFNGGKAYYDPKQKAEIYDHSIDALLCIQTEAVGIDALDIVQLDATQKQLGSLLAGRFDLDDRDDDELEVSASKRYFDLIAASLLSVERVTAHRLSNVGSYDPEGVVAQIERLNQKIRNDGEDPETEGDGGGVGGDEGGTDEGADENGSDVQGEDDALDSQAAKTYALRIGTTSSALQSTKIDLKVLKPKLDKCILRAKM